MLHARISLVSPEGSGYMIKAKTGSKTRVVESHTAFYRRPEWDEDRGELYLPSVQGNYEIERPRVHAEILLIPSGFDRAVAWTYLSEWEKLKEEKSREQRIKRIRQEGLPPRDK